MKKLFVAAFVMTIIAGPSAYADVQTAANSVSVRYDDVDLKHEAGANVLMYRIKAAARVACGEAPDLREMQQRGDYNACVSRATDQAVEAVHSPLVASASGHSLAPEFVASR